MSNTNLETTPSFPIMEEFASIRVIRIWLFLGSLLCLSNLQVAAEECKDTNRSCYYWYLMDYCKNPAFASAMFDTCRKTCGYCPITGARKNSRRKSTGQASCKDTYDICPRYKQAGYCQTYPDYMKLHCKLSCGICSVVPTTLPPPAACKDENNNCPSWKQHCVKGGTYWAYMSKNCRKTCALCTDGGGGGGGGGANGKKQFTCGFESNFCQWSNQPIDDAVDWAVGTVAGGPSAGDSSASYAYVKSTNLGYTARLVLPWELILPVGTTYIGTMCLNFSFQTGDGSLEFIETPYPNLNNKNPSPQSKGTFKGSGTWVKGKVQVNVDSKRKLTIEGKAGSSGRVVIDNIAFVKGSC